MSGGNQRRSSRVPTTDERKAEQMRSENKAKGKGLATLEDSGNREGSFNSNLKRKRLKTKSIQDLVGNYGYEDHSSDSSEEPPVALPTPVLPDRRKLKLLLETLKKRDGRNIFAEPVDPDEVEGYYDTIKEPMDFGTMATKLNEGRYQTLAEFEHDVTLVYSNGMHFNASSTVFYRQARYIRDLAKKLFALLKADPNNFERAVADLKVRAGRREDTGVSISKTRNRDQSTNSMASNGSEEEIQYQYDKEDQLGAYRPRDSLLKRNESILSSLYKNTEPCLPMEDANLDEVGYKGSWKRFVKNLGPTAEMAADRKLSTDFEAFNNHSAIAPHQLKTKKYGTLNAPSWNVEDNNIPEDILRNAIRSQYLSGVMDFQGGGVDGQKVLAIDTLDYNEALSRGLLPIGSGVGNPGIFNGKSLQASVEGGVRFKQNLTDQSVDSPHFSTPWNNLRSNSNNFISQSINKGKNVQMMQANSLNSEEIPGNYRGNLVQPPMVRNSFPKESTSFQFTGNYYSTPGNQDNCISGSINKGKKSLLMEDPTSFFLRMSDGFPERTSIYAKETEGAAVNRYLPNQGIGSSNYTTLLVAENSHFSGAENTQGNTDKFYPGPGIMGMNVQTEAGMSPGVVQANPYDNLKQSTRSVGDGDSAFNEFMPNQEFRGGYFTNLLRFGVDPLAKFDATDDAEKFIQAAQYQDTSSFQVPGINFSGPMIQDPPSAMHHGVPSSAALQLPAPAATGPSPSLAANQLSLNSTGKDKDVRQLQAFGGYGGGTSSGGTVGQAGQNSSWPQPSEWTRQPNFYFPVQGEPRTAEAGLGAQAAALLMHALGTHGGADEQHMAGSSARNYPSNL